jgi:anti-sigma regulatory factor (Ser/Thr protein kinase)
VISPDRDRRLVRLVTPSGMPSLALLRNRIEAALPGLGTQAVGDIQVVATELVTNAYLHGQPPVRFELVATAEGAVLRMEVTDTGPGTPRTEHPDVDTFHGRGLLLISKIATSWGVTRTADGKTVWAEFALHDGSVS